MLGNEETPVVETGVPQPVDMLETVTAAVKLEQKTSQEPVKNEVLNAPPKQDEDMDFELDIPDELLTGMDLDVTMPTAVAPMAPVEKKKFEYAQPKVQTSAPSTSTFVQAPSFQNDQDLKTEIIRLAPVKIDIGAVYNFPPANKKTTSAGFVPQERELVFDIDMTDYDEIRTCCSGGAICKKCWSFMTLSVKILDRALKEDFGFKHRLWVYSGRRGVHCWIADERARKLPAEARRAIVNYLEVVKGGENTEKKVNLRAQIHPSLKKAYHILEKNFAKIILKDMAVLDTKETWTKVLQLIPDDEIRRELDSEWDDDPSLSSTDKWEKLISKLAWKEKEKKKMQLGYTARDIILQYSYPRLDSNVSIGLNHLLKSPFCIHPKTGRVCVPIDPDRCDEFDPFVVPTLTSLIDELNAYEKENAQKDPERRVADYEKTSLKPYVEHFKGFLKGMSEDIRDALRAKKVEEDKKLTF